LQGAGCPVSRVIDKGSPVRALDNPCFSDGVAGEMIEHDRRRYRKFPKFNNPVLQIID
jgi:hypothetical protein